MHTYAEFLSLALVLLFVMAAMSSHKEPRAAALCRDMPFKHIPTLTPKIYPALFEHFESAIDEYDVVCNRYETPWGA